MSVSTILRDWMLLAALSALNACDLGSARPGRALAASPEAVPWKAFADGRFAWKSSGPLVAPDVRAAGPAISIKDPSVIFDRGRWHLFCTVRFASGRVDMVSMSFTDWEHVAEATQHVLGLHDDYCCAPQVFYFRPHQRWYLICQIADKHHQPPFGPVYATSTEPGNPKSWSKLQWLFPEGSERRKWLDFWVICDRTKAHLFYTSLDGRMWRSETRLSEFPVGWSEPQVALQTDIFEASHTYKLKGIDKYLTIVEAQGDSRRYYKAYLADHLEGPWTGLADSPSRSFAAFSNVAQEKAWTTNVSHGELFRSGVDETMEVDPANVRMLFQGASDAEYRGNSYGKIPWRLGILEMAR